MSDLQNAQIMSGINYFTCADQNVIVVSVIGNSVSAMVGDKL